MAPPKRKTTNPGAPDTEGTNLHDVPIGQSPPTEPTPEQLALQAKKVAAANKKTTAASEAEKRQQRQQQPKLKHRTTLSRHENNQPEQILHDELNLELQALEMKKAHLANQLATKKRAAEQAQKLAEAKCRVAEM